MSDCGPLAASRALPLIPRLVYPQTDWMPQLTGKTEAIVCLEDHIKPLK